MRFGLLYHHQVPRPWTQDSEARVIRESLEQIELADRLGYDCVWATEHHFLEEYSHGSAPEVFLAAAAARTERIRLAHGIVSLPASVNHPARVAERLAVLDIVSGGRVEFGSGQGSTQHELGAFGVERETKREQWLEAIGVVTRMMADSPFTGHHGRWIDVPPRNVVPKPVQKPHPPLWLACSNADTIRTAARLGMGALSIAFISVEEAAEWAAEYYAIINSDECVPVGRTVNPNFAIVMPFLCAQDEQTARERGVDGAHFFAHAFGHYYAYGQHRPGNTDLGGAFNEIKDGYADMLPPEMADRVQSLYRGIGTPEQLRTMIRKYEAAGIDQIIFQAQIGSTRHEHIVESLELFAGEVMPEFAERRAASDAAKEQRLSAAVDKALGRIAPDGTDVSDYVIATDMEAFGPPQPQPVG